MLESPLTTLFQFLNDIPGFWPLLGLFSAIAFLSTLIIVPVLILRIPADRFASETPHPSAWARYHPVLRILLHLGKNLVGLLLVTVGILLLVLPGQGLLSIVFGIMLLDFPGRYRLKRWLIRRPSVLKTVNWLRRRYERPPLYFHEDPTDSNPPHQAGRK